MSFDQFWILMDILAYLTEVEFIMKILWALKRMAAETVINRQYTITFDSLKHDSNIARSI